MTSSVLFKGYTDEKKAILTFSQDTVTESLL